MSFDEEIDALKQSIADERGGDGRAERAAALEGLYGKLHAIIESRRVEFVLDDGSDSDDEPTMVVTHAATGEELGAVYVEDEGFAFESDDDDYFGDIAATTDPEAFARALYETLKTGLPVYELDVEADQNA